MAAHLLPVRTVGVQGDGRSYSYLCALTLDEDPSSKWADLLRLAKAIPGRVHQVNRVVFMLGNKLQESPKTITPTHLSDDVIEQESGQFSRACLPSSTPRKRHRLTCCPLCAASPS